MPDAQPLLCERCQCRPIKPKRKRFCSDACKFKAMRAHTLRAQKQATAARKRHAREHLIATIQAELRALASSGSLAESALVQLVLEHRARASQNERVRFSRYGRLAA